MVDKEITARDEAAEGDMPESCLRNARRLQPSVLPGGRQRPESLGVVPS